MPLTYGIQAERPRMRWKVRGLACTKLSCLGIVMCPNPVGGRAVAECQLHARHCGCRAVAWGPENKPLNQDSRFPYLS